MSKIRVLSRRMAADRSLEEELDEGLKLAGTSGYPVRLTGTCGFEIVMFPQMSFKKVLAAAKDVLYGKPPNHLTEKQKQILQGV